MTAQNLFTDIFYLEQVFYYLEVHNANTKNIKQQRDHI